MYHEYYNLKSDPFRLSPDSHFCQRHPGFSKAKAYMQFAVERAEGFVMITGRPGTGKTTLIEDVLAELDGQEFLCAHLVSAQLEADDLLRMVAFNFGIPAREHGKSELLMEMQGFFADHLADGRRALLVVDEAQGLSLEAMEELRLLTNIRIGARPMLQIFLVGQESLRELIQDPRMEQLHQRLIASCHLEPLDFKQTASYVMHRLKVAGWRGNPKLRARIFPALYRFSHGIPRRINLFMGRLLLHGWLEERDELSEPEAREVWEDLRQEHLVATWDEGEAHAHANLSELDAMAGELPTPDQTIGAKLLEQERQRPIPHPASPRPEEAPAPGAEQTRNPGAAGADERWPEPQAGSEERLPSVTVSGAAPQDEARDDEEEPLEDRERPRRKKGLGGFLRRFFLGSD